jgi:hypothetical protein
MSVYSPGRPPNERDLILLLNGSPQISAANGGARGILTSSGSAVNNVTTATPFNTGLQPDGSYSPSVKNGTASASLAGRVLAVHATAAGFFAPASWATMGNPNVGPDVATTATIPPAAGTFPGVPIAAGEIKLVIMLPGEGWLQFISSSGTASLVVWELL